MKNHFPLLLPVFILNRSNAGAGGHRATGMPVRCGIMPEEDQVDEVRPGPTEGFAAVFKLVQDLHLRAMEGEGGAEDV